MEEFGGENSQIVVFKLATTDHLSVLTMKPMDYLIQLITYTGRARHEGEAITNILRSFTALIFWRHVTRATQTFYTVSLGFLCHVPKTRQPWGSACVATLDLP